MNIYYLKLNDVNKNHTTYSFSPKTDERWLQLEVDANGKMLWVLHTEDLEADVLARHDADCNVEFCDYEDIIPEIESSVVYKNICSYWLSRIAENPENETFYREQMQSVLIANGLKVL